MKKRKPLNILFIGNSHTYYNDMPLMVQRRAIECGCDCRITMIAHGGWFLAQHAEEPMLRVQDLISQPSISGRRSLRISEEGDKTGAVFARERIIQNRAGRMYCTCRRNHEIILFRPRKTPLL